MASEVVSDRGAWALIFIPVAEENSWHSDARNKWKELFCANVR